MLLLGTYPLAKLGFYIIFPQNLSINLLSHTSNPASSTRGPQHIQEMRLCAVLSLTRVEQMPGARRCLQHCVQIVNVSKRVDLLWLAPLVYNR